MFKKVIIIFLCLLYSISSFREFVPFVEYYYNYNYIVENLCINRDNPESECNGHCYLEKQVDKQEKQEKEAISDKFAFDSIYLFVQENFEIKLIPKNIYFREFYLRDLEEDFPREINHPPNIL
jgi:hypothetical protein